MRSFIDSVKNGLYEQLFNSIEEDFSDGSQEFSFYQNDPVGFAENALGETLTDDVKVLMESVRDHQVTISAGNGSARPVQDGMPMFWSMGKGHQNSPAPLWALMWVNTAVMLCDDYVALGS